MQNLTPLITVELLYSLGPKAAAVAVPDFAHYAVPMYSLNPVERPHPTVVVGLISL